MRVLPPTIAGSPPAGVPLVWTDLPYTNALRTALIRAAAVTTDLDEQGLVVMSLGQLTEAYNVCAELSLEVPLNLSTVEQATRRRPLTETEQALQPYYRLIPNAMAEAKAAGLPEAHLRFVYPYIASASLRHRVSGIATFITLVSLFLASTAGAQEAPTRVPRRYYLTATRTGAAPTPTFSSGNANGATATIISVDPRWLTEVKPGGAGTYGNYAVSSFATGRRKFAWDVWTLELPAGMTTIEAQQWKFVGATRQPGALGFLVNEIALYVVRAGALVGKIYDSTAGSSGPSLPATVAGQPQADVIAFSGNALSGLQAGDRLYLEVWSDWVLPGIAAGGSVYFYWNGNDEPTTENEVTTTSVASYLDCERM